MIFADKIIRLRKKNGMSQEELAEKMSVSRQAVSKWEGAQAIPDLAKILQLASLFGVTTDYLLKDEMESEEFTQDDAQPVKRVTLEMANEYLSLRKKASVQIAVATFMCIIAAIPLILLGALSEYPQYNISDSFAGALGLIILLVAAAAAAAIFVYCGFKSSPYEFLEKEPFGTDYGVDGMVREKQKEFRSTYVKLNIAGTTLCVLSPIALFAGAFSNNDLLTVIMLAVTMVVAGLGVIAFILGGVREESMKRLLREGEYSEKEKKNSTVSESISLIYWLTAVAIYLGVSFISGSWSTSWIVWPIAGVLYAVVITVVKLIVKNK